VNQQGPNLSSKRDDSPLTSEHYKKPEAVTFIQTNSKTKWNRK